MLETEMFCIFPIYLFPRMRSGPIEANLKHNIVLAGKKKIPCISNIIQFTHGIKFQKIWICLHILSFTFFFLFC